MSTLTPKQAAFCQEYLLDIDASAAAVRAGYSSVRGGKQAAYELMQKPHIRAEIQRLMDSRSRRLDITADRVLQEIAAMGFVNMQDLYDAEGNLRSLADLPREVAAALQEVHEDESGRRRVKLADKKGSLELLGKHLKLFREQVSVSNPDGSPLFGGVRVTFVSPEKADG